MPRVEPDLAASRRSFTARSWDSNLQDHNVSKSSGSISFDIDMRIRMG